MEKGGWSIAPNAKYDIIILYDYVPDRPGKACTNT